MMVRHAHLDEVVSEAGIVSAPDARAASAGAEVLRAGGNAVDAAVATALAIGVVEPHMSGLGGGTWMVVRLTDPERCVVVDGPVVAPSAARPDMFPVLPDSGPTGLYGWPTVENDANIAGPLSVGVPGTVSALHTAQTALGTLEFRDVAQPAIRLAADGIEVNWFTSALIVQEAARLAADPGCANLFLPGGLPLKPTGLQPGSVLRQPQLADTLEQLADDGASAFYRGRIGRSLVNLIRESGGILRQEDLHSYQARVHENPAVGHYQSATILGPPRTGVPTVIETLHLLDLMGARGRDTSEAAAAVAWARSLLLAFRDRFRWMTADEKAAVPWTALASPDYAAEILDAHRAKKEPRDPREFEQSQVTGSLGPSGCTSHISVADRQGNLVALTQTVLDVFGARMLDPATGILLNDGMMWFDPRPGGTNQIGPGVPGLSAVSPILLITKDGRKAALGAAGGRKVMSSTAQVAARIVAGDTAQAAIEYPRIHAETEAVLVEPRWPAAVIEALAREGFQPQVVEEQPTTWNFGRPGCVIVEPTGLRRGGVDPIKPGGVAAQ
ncbi:MAG: gamma-glutamyltransferase family protein [Streptosporangiaceae bacterium]